MSSDKCPKCGSERDGIHASPHYLCGSGDAGHGLEQSEECKLRCELAELKERHQRLVDAARKVTDKHWMRIASNCESCSGIERHEKDCVMNNLHEALESEAKK